MAASTLHAEVELKSAAEKFWESMRDSTILFPKVFPDLYKSIEVLEGDGKCPGSIRLINYADGNRKKHMHFLFASFLNFLFFFGIGSPLVKVSKEKIDTVDEGKKEVSYSVIGGDLLKYYKNFNGTIHVATKGEGSLVKWSCGFEKVSDEVPDPHIIKDFAIENFKDLDVFLLKA